MKKTILLLALVALGTGLSAQSFQYDKIYYRYKGGEGVVALKVPGFVMRMAASIGDLDREEKALLRSLRSVSVLTIDENELYPGVNFAREFASFRGSDDTHILLEVHDSGEDVLIAAREKNGRITDLFVAVGGDDNVLVHVKGRMDRDLLENLAGVAGIDELRFTSEI
ncbi:MAG: DUF4252 domain-containing protein [Bacteroidales bacterium]